jgi:putative peptidoglycan lipid II flippase
MIWIALPVAVLCYFCRGYLARLIFKRGAPEIALLFGLLTAAIFFRIIYTLFSRYFYSHKDTVTPLLVSLFAIGLNVVLVFSLASPNSYGAAGLALAQSVVAATEVGILLAIMLYRDNHLFSAAFLKSLLKILSVTGFTVLAAFIMISLLPLNITDRGFFTLGIKLGTIVSVTMGVHLLFSSLFGLPEASAVIRRLKALILKPVRIQ